MKVALVRLSALGDVVHALPVAAALHAARPDARVSWIVERRHAAVLRGHPALAEVVAVDTHAWRRARRPAAVRAVVREMAALRRRLAAGAFDAALDLQGLLKSGLVAAATGAPLRVGFSARACREPLAALCTTRRVTPPPSARHVVDKNLALLDALGVRPAGPPVFDLPVAAAAEGAAEDFFGGVGLKPRDRVVALNPGAARAAKRWPVARFAALARALVAAGTARVIVLWGPAELDAARAIAAGGGHGVVLAPATGLFELIAVLRRVSVLVSGDTGPLHLAAAAGTACVGLFGPTRAERNGPYGAGHRTLQAADGVIDGIEPAAVQRAVEDLLG
jgi:lipopolysaccharide heptosyltransferase I